MNTQEDNKTWLTEQNFTIWPDAGLAKGYPLSWIEFMRRVWYQKYSDKVRSYRTHVGNAREVGNDLPRFFPGIVTLNKQKEIATLRTRYIAFEMELDIRYPSPESLRHLKQSLRACDPSLMCLFESASGLSLVGICRVDTELDAAGLSQVAPRLAQVKQEELDLPEVVDMKPITDCLPMPSDPDMLFIPTAGVIEAR